MTSVRGQHTPRDTLFIQSKFTSPGGQDPRNCPYKLTLPLASMVKMSVTTSLAHLDTYLDALLLHSPMETHAETLEAYRVLEDYVRLEKIWHLGVSNVALPELERLYEECQVKPAIVQNRFWPGNNWDVDVRRFCRDHGMVWQSFWTLSGNPQLLKSGVVQRVAIRVLEDSDKKEEALYLLVLALGRGWEKGGGVAILDGTTREVAMKSDCEAAALVGEVSDAELGEFKGLIGEEV